MEKINSEELEKLLGGVPLSDDELEKVTGGNDTCLLKCASAANRTDCVMRCLK